MAKAVPGMGLARSEHRCFCKVSDINIYLGTTYINRKHVHVIEMMTSRSMVRRNGMA